MASFKDFNVTQLAKDNTKKIAVIMPTGEDTGHFVEICSTLHPKFRQAQTEMQRSRREAILNGKVVEELTTEEIVASCVIGWSFDEEVTVENVVEFLKNMPNIADEINIEASNQQNFFPKQEKN